MKDRPRLIRLFLSHTLPLVAAVLLLGLGASLLSFQSTRWTSYDNEVRLLEQLNLYYENMLSEIDALNLIFSTNSQLVEALRTIMNTRRADYENYKLYQLYGNLLTAFLTARPYIDSIMMYLPNDQGLVFSDKGMTSLEETENGEWFIAYMQSGHPDQAEFCLSGGNVRISRPVRTASGVVSGVIVLDLKAQSLIDAYLPFRSYRGEHLKVETEDGLLLLEYPMGESRASRQVTFSSSSSAYALSYTLSVPFRTLYASSLTILFLSLGIGLFSLVLGFLLVYRTERDERLFISNVLSQLRKAGATAEMDELESGESIYLYLNDKILRSFLEKDYLRLQKEAAEYRALQMQINPHFLFNTLDTIYWKAVRLKGGENDASRMVHDLSRLLKYSLRANPQEGALLREEIEQVETYIGIQQVRFRDKFKFIKDYGALPEMRVPVFTLQPLIENCFNHGFVEGERLVITLSVKDLGDRVDITVSNDGKGAGQSLVDSLNQASSQALASSSSIGLSNIRERLQLFFQGRALMTVAAGSERGFQVTISISAE